ncbi:MAG: FAD-dependent oxidoreductase [Acidobacteria bacterium]|nr:FAD-dependent oxidoreductase [Acidobacteriota bacterium]
MKVIIIEGVAGGMSTATRLRRLMDDAEIVVYEKSGFVSYANCGLPYFVGGVIQDEASLLLQTPTSLYERFRIDVRVNHEVTSINAEERTVTVIDHTTGHGETTGYDVLVLSPGASAVVPPIEGIERAMALRTVEDVEKIVAVTDENPANAVVIGGGFIGVEIAENLVHRGISTSVVEASGQVLAPLDLEMAELVADEMRRKGVSLFLNESVVRIDERGVELSSGDFVAGDLVIVAIGVRPETGLARGAGLAIGERGGIAVDEFNRTSVANIYAIGDAAEKRDALDSSATLVPLANIANRQGRVVADHIAGLEVRPLATIGTAIVKVFDLTIAATGWNEKRLRAMGHSPLIIHTHPSSHAGYFPGAKQMALKLLINRSTGAIYGAQGVGTEGVDKRIDVLATAIRAGITAPELADLELAYAPPFGSAKDPVNMLGYIAENLLSGLEENVQWYELDEYRAEGVAMIDVRSVSEFARGSIPGALNIPLDELRVRFDEILTRDVIVNCQVGQRGHVATQLLNQNGFKAKNLDGGYLTWSKSPASRPLELAGASHD